MSQSVKNLVRQFFCQIGKIPVEAAVFQYGDQLIFCFRAPNSFSLSESFFNIRNGVLELFMVKLSLILTTKGIEMFRLFLNWEALNTMFVFTTKPIIIYTQFYNFWKWSMTYFDDLKVSDSALSFSSSSKAALISSFL
jgi:hypothetical protein